MLSAQTHDPSPIPDLPPPPHPAYLPALAALRDAATGGRWPGTSVARSQLLQGGSGASFTVCRPGTCVHTREPLANRLFPELVTAVFALEVALSLATGRPASSYCAVNRNASFTPHVDSGVGAGQSLSLIVGLGDYVGGELCVEGGWIITPF